MKILVRAPNWVGDAVMAIPALQALRHRHAGAQISILARPSVGALFSEQPFVDYVLEYDHRGHHRGWLGREKLIRQLRAEEFDVAVLLQNAFEAAWLAWRAGIPERVGYARDGRSALLTKSVRVPHVGEAPAHESYYYLELLRRAELADTPAAILPIHLEITESGRAAAESLLRTEGARNGALRCAIAPGASFGAAKCWPPRQFAALADRLISECAADVLFFGTPGEKEIVAQICSAMKLPAISMAGETSVRDLAALFSACSLFIGNDSGAMHVAAAAGIPVIGIFGSTDPEGTAPVTPHFTLIREPVSCSPCFLRQCPVDHRCMTRISVDSVFTAVQRVCSAARSPQLGGTQNV